MARFVKTVSQKFGLPPGTLVHVGTQKVDRVRMRVLDYDLENVEEREVQSVEECFPFRDQPTVTWINVDGLHDPDLIQRLGSHFGLHPLVLEDIVNTTQRPKVEEHETYVFVSLRMLRYLEEKGEVDDEQVSLILGSQFVLSFQERAGDVFDPVRERIRAGKGRLRGRAPDYLVYALMDVVVDHYFLILEKLGERVEGLQQELIVHPAAETLQSIHRLKREMILLRRSVWPLREVLGTLQREESPLVQRETIVFFRDVYDHTIQVMDTIESLRDMVSGMLDIYLSGMSNRLNEVVKTLTIVATIFIPLGFIAGVYGMNFVNIPELQLPFGYFLALGAMAAVGTFMLAQFRRRGWL